jgi:DNA polymerase-3 subunit beta
MQFTTTAKRLKQALQIVEAVLPTRTTLPAATHVKMSTKNGRLTLTTTNLHNFIHYTYATDITEDGVAVVPAKRFLDFVKTLSGEEISAKLDSQRKRLDVATEGIQLELPTLDDQEFPDPPPEKGLAFKIKQADLKEALRLTSFATEQNTDRYILNGCFLYFSEDGKCQVIATDARRLAKYTFDPVSLPAEPDKARFLIPNNVAEVLADHLIHDVDLAITIGEKRVSLCFETPGQDTYFLHFSQVEGKYPDCRSLIPNLNHANSINRMGFLLALKRAISIVDAEGRVQLKFQGNRLEIEARGSNTAASSSACLLVEKLPVEFSGKPLTTSFSPKYIAQALEEMTEDNVSFDLEGEGKPIVFNGNSYLYLNMPLRS